MSAWAILAAAGEGSRLGRGPKAFLPVAGAPMIAHSLVVLAKAPSIEGIVAVVPASRVGAAQALASAVVPAARVVVVAGGSSRQSSVRSGLAAVPADAEHVIVHDAARPLITVELVEATLAALTDAPGAVVCVPASDTLKRVSEERVSETVSREGLWRAQTPQAFRAGVLRDAHARSLADGVDATDDAALLERIGEAVAVVPGDERNVKVTTPEELALAEALLAVQREAP